MNPRRILLELFDAAVSAVAGRECVAPVLRGLPSAPVALFAIGKAAAAMTRGAYSVLGAGIQQALLVTKDGHVDPEIARFANLTVLECAHPVPDQRSLAAGAELERRINALSPDTCPVFLISGGSSSLIELLQPGVSLEDLRTLNTRGLAAGWDIVRLNEERRRLSRLKGGGVARLLQGRPAHALFISDVPDDSPGVIGSGLLGPEPGRADRVQRVVVANLAAATHRAGEIARTHGLDLEVRAERFAGDAADVAREFVAALRDTSADGLIWGGESTVILPQQPGRGGRNTHLALAAARALRSNETMTILAAGTDGTDGPTEDAGAIVDAGTVERAELGGVDVERAWFACDSGAALEAAGDLVHTGPTGTNVGDLLIGIKQPHGRVRDLPSLRVL